MRGPRPTLRCSATRASRRSSLLTSGRGAHGAQGARRAGQRSRCARSGSFRRCTCATRRLPTRSCSPTAPRTCARPFSPRRRTRSPSRATRRCASSTCAPRGCSSLRRLPDRGAARAQATPAGATARAVDANVVLDSGLRVGSLKQCGYTRARSSSRRTRAGADYRVERFEFGHVQSAGRGGRARRGP